jgi:hypothetical protein
MDNNTALKQYVCVLLMVLSVRGPADSARPCGCMVTVWSPDRFRFRSRRRRGGSA